MIYRRAGDRRVTLVYPARGTAIRSFRRVPQRDWAVGGDDPDWRAAAPDVQREMAGIQGALQGEREPEIRLAILGAGRQVSGVVGGETQVDRAVFCFGVEPRAVPARPIERDVERPVLGTGVDITAHAVERQRSVDRLEHHVPGDAFHRHRAIDRFDGQVAMTWHEDAITHGPSLVVSGVRTVGAYAAAPGGDRHAAREVAGLVGRLGPRPYERVHHDAVAGPTDDGDPAVLTSIDRERLGVGEALHAEIAGVRAIRVLPSLMLAVIEPFRIAGGGCLGVGCDPRCRHRQHDRQPVSHAPAYGHQRLHRAWVLSVRCRKSHYGLARGELVRAGGPSHVVPARDL